MIRRVGNEKVACSVHCDIGRLIELCSSGGPLTVVSGGPISSHGTDEARGDLADTVIVVVCDKDIPGTIAGNLHRMIELCRGGWPSIAAKPGRTTSYGADDPSGNFS